MFKGTRSTREAKLNFALPGGGVNLNTLLLDGHKLVKSHSRNAQRSGQPTAA